MARNASSQRGQARTKQELVLMLGIDKDWNTKNENTKYQPIPEAQIPTPTPTFSSPRTTSRVFYGSVAE